MPFRARSRTSAKAARASAICGASDAAAAPASDGRRRPAARRRTSAPSNARSPPLRRRRVEPVLEHECGDAPCRERAGDVRALVLHRQRAEAAAGCDDHRRAGRFRGARQEGRQRRDGYVAGEAPIVLAIPTFRCRRARDWAGSEHDPVVLGGSWDRRHLVILRLRGCRQEVGDSHREAAKWLNVDRLSAELAIFNLRFTTVPPHGCAQTLTPLQTCSAKTRNAGQFGPVVWPASCSR